MSKSYALTDAGLKIRNSRNFEAEEYVCFTSINPVAQALRDCIVTGPGLIPGLAAAGICLQAQTYANTSIPEAFYYTLQEAVLALKAARPYSLPLSRTVATISRLVADLVSSHIRISDCCKALDHLHSILCDSIDKDEMQIRRSLDKTIPKDGSIIAVGGFGAQHSVSLGTLVPTLIARKNTAKSVPLVYCPTAAPLTETHYTVKELQSAGCDAMLVTDGSLPAVMLQKDIKAVYVMGVRICANGDVQAPSSSTGIAAVAKQLGIPVHVIAYRHCFDASYSTGIEVPCEEYHHPQNNASLSQLAPEPFVNLIPREWVSDYVTSQGLVPASSVEKLKPFMETADTVLLAALEAVRRLI